MTALMRESLNLEERRGGAMLKERGLDRYARKGFVRRKDAYVFGVVSFLLGSVAGARLLAGSRIPMKCFEAGNSADWIAAIAAVIAAAGTWVIGVAANRYAERSRLEAKDEKRQGRMTEAQAGRVRLTAAALAAVPVCGSKISADSYFAVETADRTIGDFDLMLNGIERSAQMVNIAPEALELLPTNAVGKITRINVTVDTVQALVLLGRRRLKSLGNYDVDARIGEAEAAIASSLKTACDSVEEMAGEFSAMATSAREKLSRPTQTT